MLRTRFRIQNNTGYWVAVQEVKLSYHNPETILCTRYPYFGNLD